jgi:cell division protein FtsI (penicillin-binding protein 3)
MSKFDYRKVMPRYRAMEYVVAFIALLIVGRALYVMTVKHDYWMQVADRVKRDSVKVAPIRGNILSCDGSLMASSLPEFKLFIDFKAIHDSGNDSLWATKEDSVVRGLSQIFPEMKPAVFKKNLDDGHKKLSRHWQIWPDRVDYGTYKDVKMLPVFRLPAYQGGFHVEEFNARRRPYGSLASRTVGALYGAKDTARFGLELSYDSILRGSNGIINRQKVLSKFLNIMVTPPTNGADIVTTIDVGMQDLAERSLIKELESINGDVGVAIVMEVATGDVKAIVNMDKCFDGQYREIKNHAVSDLLEPGSVFKPLSIMVALDDGVVDTTCHVETGCGVWPMYGREMKDHNWRKGGYGMLSLPQTLQFSSNVGVSRIIDDNYHKNPEKYIRGLYRIGIADNFHIPLVGSSPAKIRMPKKNKRGEWVNWSDTALPWMSIGYESQVPPISTLTFYNAIANGGKMVQPRFVKQVIKDGEVIMDFPVRVLHEHICKKKTLGEMQTILEHVVSQGLGKKAGSKAFKVAGKTGTAQISQGTSGYKSGATHYLLSFAGYFPADNPKYSCIVCIQKRGIPASGGGMSGVVFMTLQKE